MASPTRRELLIALLGAPAAMGLSAQSLTARLDGDYLHISAPRLRFLTGRTLERLHDGASIGFIAQLSLSLDGNATVQSRSVARFALSYDIWEETFSVIRIQQVRRTASHLSLDSAQNWVIDNLALDASAVPQAKPFWLRFEIRAEDPRDGLDIIGGSGINLTRLVEAFSRPPKSTQQRWAVDAGPFSYADVKARVAG